MHNEANETEIKKRQNQENWGRDSFQCILVAEFH